MAEEGVDGADGEVSGAAEGAGVGLGVFAGGLGERLRDDVDEFLDGLGLGEGGEEFGAELVELLKGE